MFAGHIGAALAIARSEPRVNIAVFAFAAMLLDAVLWVFILAGWESASLPVDLAAYRMPQFVFPYSHSLIGSIVWSMLAGTVALFWFSRHRISATRAAALLAAAVFSHWLLDALVHLPELPIAGDASTKVGLGLWLNMPVALVVEALILLIGLSLYLSGAPLACGRKIALAVLSLLILGMTVIGMTVAPPAPSVLAMAVSSLITIAVVSALFYWLSGSSNKNG